jgi:hypothetical protein
VREPLHDGVKASQAA